MTSVNPSVDYDACDFDTWAGCHNAARLAVYAARVKPDYMHEITNCVAAWLWVAWHKAVSPDISFASAIEVATLYEQGELF